MKFRGLGIAFMLAILAAPMAAPRRVHACGGLFCNATQPVNQAAERIIFAHNEDGTVTAIIEIQYDGPSERFSWLLPVPGRPVLGVSSKTALDRLQGFTNPTYIMQTRFEDGCNFAQDAGVRIDFGEEDAGSGGPEEPPVIVLGQGTVGPFDYIVIRVDPDLEDRAQVATEWLENEGFDVPRRTSELLNPYLDADLNLLAIKLTKGNDAGAIRPIRITYEGSRPFIPIRPTAVAANDDMGVLVFVAGEARAIPENYKALELNEALIDWFNPMRTYNAVVGAAADESGGQGFVTEYAQRTDVLEDLVVRDSERAQFERVSTSTYDSSAALVRAAAGAFSTWDGFEDAVGQALTRPASLSVSEYLGCPECYEDDADVALDHARFIEQLTQRVYEPMASTQDLVMSRPYMTRLYTTMSADEMTVDPLFNFNGDLPDVSNVHMAERVNLCAGGFRVTLPQGGVVYGKQVGTWPIEIGGDHPAARVIRELGTSGEGRVVVDNSKDIRALLDRDLPELPVEAGRLDGGRLDGGRDGGRGDAAADAGSSVVLDDDCNCSVPGAPANNTRAAWLMGVLGLALAARRRR